MMQKRSVHIAAFTLVVIGGLNWGLIGLFGGFNLVELILGGVPILERLVYILVGLSAAYLLATHKKDCRTCSLAAGAHMDSDRGGGNESVRPRQPV